MKKSIKLFTAVLSGLVLTSTVFTACDTGLTDIKIPSEENKASGEKAYIVVKDVFSDATRTINPVLEAADFYYIKLSGIKDGKNNTLGAYYSKDGLKAIEKLMNDRIEIAPGQWTFELGGNFSGTNLDSTTETVYKDKIEVNVTAGTNVLSFNLQQYSFSNNTAREGTYELTLNIPESVKYVEYKLVTESDTGATKDKNGTSGKQDVTDGTVIISGDVTKGTYVLEVKFYTDSSKATYLGSYRELVNIIADLTSKAERVLDRVENLYTIEYNLNGGQLRDSVTFPSSFSKHTAEFNLPDTASVVKLNGDGEEMFFAGWYDNEALTGEPVTKILNGTTSNFKLYAKWLGYCTVNYNGGIFAPKKVPCGDYIGLDLVYPSYDYENYSIVADKVSLNGTPVEDKILITDDLTLDVENFYYYCTYNKVNYVYETLTEEGEYKIKIKTSATNLNSTQMNTIKSSLTKESPVAKVILDLTEFSTFDFYSSSSSSSYYAQAVKEIILPPSFTEYRSYMFANMKGLEKFELPQGITSIPEYLFDGCSSLKEIIIPSSVTAINKYACRNCSSLTSVVIPDSVTSIGSYIFYNCTELNSIQLGSGLKTIGGYAFYGCSKLTSIEIPEGVTTIEAYTFTGNKSLKSVKIPSTLTTTNDAFSSSTIKLEELHLADIDAYCRLTGSFSAVEDGLKVYKDGELVTSVVLGDEVTSVSANKFNNWADLEEFIMSDSVTSVSERAFANCKKLKKLVVSKSVTSIGKEIVTGCSSLEEIELPFIGSTPSNLEVFAKYFFGTTQYEGAVVTTIYNSTTKYYIPSNLKKITITAQNNFSSSNGDLSGLSTVEEIILPEGLTTIPYSTFARCSSLKKITIPSTVTTINSSAFTDCTSVEEMYISSLSGWCALSKQDYPFKNSTAENKKVYINNQLVTKVEIPSDVSSIASNSFAGWNCVTELTIPSSVTSIGYSAFEACNGIKKLNIESFEAWCNIKFSDRTAQPLSGSTNAEVYLNGELFEHAEVPETISKIDPYAFNGFSSLKSLIIPSEAVLPSYDFSKKTGDFLNGCNNLEFISAGKFIPNFFGANDTDIPVSLKKIEITAENISDSSFKNMSYVEELSLPNVVSVSENPFSGLKGLKKLYITDLEKYMGISFSYYNSSPFFNSNSEIRELYLNGELVENLEIPAGTEAIKDYVFYKISSIKSIDFGEASLIIDYSAFARCSGLESLYLPSTITSVESSAFNSCSNLKELIFESADIYDNNSFKDSPIEKITVHGGDLKSFKDLASTLTEFVIAEDSGISEIPESAFYNCAKLEKLYLPSTIASIGDNAFYNCSKLSNVYISSTGIWLNIVMETKTASPFNKSGAGHLYNLDGEEFTELTVTETMDTIRAYPLTGLAGIEKLNVNGIITSVEIDSFLQCPVLTKLNFSSEETEKAWFKNDFPTSMFAYNRNGELFVDNVKQTSLILSEAAGTNSISGFKDLTVVKVPAGGSVTYCPDLEEVELSVSKAVSSYLTGSTSKLTKVTISGGVLVKNAFANLTKITDLTISKNVESIVANDRGYNSLADLKELKTLTLGYLGSSAETPVKLVDLFDYTVPGSITNVTVESESICDSAFSGAKYLVEVTLPEDLTAIPENCFSGCSSLTKVNYSDSLTEIKAGAFTSATKLTSFEFKDSITAIGDKAFKESGITSLDLNNVESIGSNAFESTAIPGVDLSNVISIGDFAFTKCNNIISVEIPETVETLGKMIFSSCSKLTSAHVKSVHSGSTMFSSCANFTTLICESEYIDDEAYMHNSTLSNVTLTKAVEIGRHGLYYVGNSNLSTVWNMPDTITVVKDYGLAYTSLTVVPDSIEEIGEGAFCCSQITNVPASLKNLSLSAYERSKISSFVCPSGITEIPAKCFLNCKSLKSIDLTGVTTIKNSAFQGTEFLYYITIPASVTSFEERAFYLSGASGEYQSKVTFEDSTSYWKIYNFTKERWEKFSVAANPGSLPTFLTSYFDGVNYYYQREKITKAEYDSLTYSTNLR